MKEELFKDLVRDHDRWRERALSAEEALKTARAEAARQRAYANVAVEVGESRRREIALLRAECRDLRERFQNVCMHLRKEEFLALIQEPINGQASQANQG